MKILICLYILLCFGLSWRQICSLNLPVELTKENAIPGFKIENIHTGNIDEIIQAEIYMDYFIITDSKGNRINSYYFKHYKVVDK